MKHQSKQGFSQEDYLEWAEDRDAVFYYHKEDNDAVDRFISYDDEREVDVSMFPRQHRPLPQPRPNPSVGPNQLTMRNSNNDDLDEEEDDEYLTLFSEERESIARRRKRPHSEYKKERDYWRKNPSKYKRKLREQRKRQRRTYPRKRRQILRRRRQLKNRPSRLRKPRKLSPSRTKSRRRRWQRGFPPSGPTPGSGICSASARPVPAT